MFSIWFRTASVEKGTIKPFFRLKEENSKKFLRSKLVGNIKFSGTLKSLAITVKIIYVSVLNESKVNRNGSVGF